MPVIAAPVRKPVSISVAPLPRRAEALLERYATVFAAFVVVLFAVWAWFASRAVRFQFDELLELSAANAATLREVVSTLAAGVDFNPPLSHFLVRASVSAFGSAEWAARLPAFLGMSALLVFLYAFVARQMGRIYGLVAMLVILCLPVREYAIQARPYGLVLGFTGMALVCYSGATGQGRRVAALAGLAVCSAALVASHYYAVLVVLVLAAAILVRACELRKLDWPLLICTGAPPIAVLFLLRRVIVAQRHQLTHYFARGNLTSFVHGYDDLAMDPMVYCLAAILAVALMTFYARTGGATECLAGLKGRPLNILALSVGLLCLPLAGAVVTQFVTHAYLTRYFLAASIGFAVCICYGTELLNVSFPGIAVLMIFPLSLGFGKAIFQEWQRSPESIPAETVLTAETTPLLFDTPEAYMKVYHYVPAVRKNIWVITDPAAALRYRQYDTDDRIMLALAAKGQAQSISLSEAVRRWPAFRLVPRTADYVWALKCVMAAGVDIQVKRAFGASNFIFDVSVPPASVSPIESCENR